MKAIYDLDSTHDVIGTTTVVLDKGQEQEISIFELMYANV